jgi:hypothetical protein
MGILANFRTHSQPACARCTIGLFSINRRGGPVLWTRQSIDYLEDLFALGSGRASDHDGCS